MCEIGPSQDSMTRCHSCRKGSLVTSATGETFQTTRSQREDEPHDDGRFCSQQLANYFPDIRSGATAQPPRRRRGAASARLQHTRTRYQPGPPPLTVHRVPCALLSSSRRIAAPPPPFRRFLLALLPRALIITQRMRHRPPPSRGSVCTRC